MTESPMSHEPICTASTTEPNTATRQHDTIAANLSALRSSKNLDSGKRKLNLRGNLKPVKDKAKKTKVKQRENVLPLESISKTVINMTQASAALKHFEDPPQTQQEKKLCVARLQYEFYDVPCETLAERLLGKVLVRQLESGTIIKGRIVETEAYLGIIDKASHTYQKRVTPRNTPMYMPPGTIYVYMTYGMYHCFNISSQGDGCAVLVRALEPIEGMSYMVNNRHRHVQGKTAIAKRPLKDFKLHQVCNGPSKLCMAYQLDRSHSKYSMCTWKDLWLDNDLSSGTSIAVVRSKRIGIDRCGPEWSSKLLRYYIYGNMCVSKRDKEAEALLDAQ